MDHHEYSYLLFPRWNVEKRCWYVNCILDHSINWTNSIQCCIPIKKKDKTQGEGEGGSSTLLLLHKLYDSLLPTSKMERNVCNTITSFYRESTWNLYAVWWYRFDYELWDFLRHAYYRMFLAYRRNYII